MSSRDRKSVQQADDLLLRRDVETRRRFVENDKIGIAGERQRDADALLLAARELVRKPCDEIGGARQSDQFEQFPRACRAASLVIDWCRIQRFGDLVAHPHGWVQRRRRVLRHEADAVAAQRVEVRTIEGARGRSPLNITRPVPMRALL